MKIDIKLFDKYNIRSIDKLQEYIDYCIKNNQKEKIRLKTEHHHILPEALFKEYSNLNSNPWNGTHLLYKDHYIAHSLLAEALDDYSMTSAWWGMNNQNQASSKIEKTEEIIGSERYSILREQAIKNISQIRLGKVNVLDTRDNKRKTIDIEDYNSFEYYISLTKGRLNVTLKSSMEKVTIDSKDYDSNLHIFHTKGKVSAISKETGKWVTLKKDEYHKNKDFYTHNSSNRVIVKDSKGNNMAVSKEEFTKGNFKGVTSDTITVTNIITNKSLRVLLGEFNNNKHLVGVANTKFYIIDDIPMRSGDAEQYLNEQGYKSTIHNFEAKKNKIKFVKSFNKISKEEYTKLIIKEPNETISNSRF